MILIIIIKVRKKKKKKKKKRRRKRMERTWQNFITQRGENFCMILGAHTQVNERALSLSIALKETTHEKTFFLCPVFFLFVGSRNFLVFFFQKLFFLFKKAVTKHLLKRL